MRPSHLLNLALLAAIVVLLRAFQRKPKCPHCAQRAGREWYGQVGYCKACGEAFTV